MKPGDKVWCRNGLCGVENSFLPVGVYACVLGQPHPLMNWWWLDIEGRPTASGVSYYSHEQNIWPRDEDHGKTVEWSDCVWQPSKVAA